MGASNGHWLATGDGALLFPYLPADASWQSSGWHEAQQILQKYPQRQGRLKVLDVGCGAGSSFYDFKGFDDRILWTGLDLSDSPEAAGSNVRSLDFRTFDGVHIPLAENEVDLIYSRQVFEHVRHPLALLHDMYRVLKPGGYLIGSTSHLEPFHSRSFWNYTPYGFCVLLSDSGFAAARVRPGIDGFTLMARRVLSYVHLTAACNPFFENESPLNLLLELIGRATRMPVTRRNAMKLLFAGHFTFVAAKVAAPALFGGEGKLA